MKPAVRLLNLGRLSYLKTLAVQQKLFDNLKSSVGTQYYNDSTKPFLGDNNNINNSDEAEQSQTPRNTLILVQHEPIYTIGIRSNPYNNEYVVKLKHELEEHNLKADLLQTNRGGLITFHGPGQLVAYPIIYMGDFDKVIKNRSLKTYVKLLESTLIDTLARAGVQGAHTVPEHPGIWLGAGERKIGFVGIACKRYVTMHGVSINCDCDLRWFDFIVSCGIEDKQVTSIQKEIFTSSLSIHPINQIPDNPTSKTSRLAESTSSTVDIISNAFCESFSEHFNCTLVEK